MSQHILNRLTVAAITSLVPFTLLATRPPPELAHVGGTFTMTYTQRHELPISDLPGHALIATESKGSNRSTGATAYMDGAEVRSAEIADLAQGTGPHQGYITFSQGGEEHVSKWNGKVTTVLDAKRQPVTTFEGSWTKVKGPAGQGSYRGRLTGPDTYTVDWQGEIELSPRAATR